MLHSLDEAMLEPWARRGNRAPAEASPQGPRSLPRTFIGAGPGYSWMQLREELLKLLEEDREFRYAVAGLLGFREILERLERHQAELEKLWSELKKLREDMNRGFERRDEELARLRRDMFEGFKRHDEEFEKIWREIERLREDMNKGFARHDEELAKLREDFNRHAAESNRRFESLEAELKKLREDMNRGFERRDEELRKLREDMYRGFKRHDEELAKLREDMKRGFERHDEELERLREDFNRMLSIIGRIEGRLTRVERTLEKLTLDIEEEAREVVRHRLREMGVDAKLERLELPGLELDIYGASGDLCILGEATVRLGKRGVEELARKVEALSRMRPDLLRPRTIVLAYTSLATREAVEEAERRGIWILKATGDVTKPPELQQ